MKKLAAFYLGLTLYFFSGYFFGGYSYSSFPAMFFMAQAQDNQTSQPAFAAMRLAHVSPDAPQLDLLIDGRLRLPDISFTELSSYIVLPAGEHELRVQPHRAPDASDTTETDVQAPEPFIISVILEPGRYYTLVSSGFFDPPPAQDQLGSLQLTMTEGTTATISGPRAYANTATENAELSDLFPGTYTVTAGREGFKTTQYEVEVGANEAATLAITLQANSEGETSAALSPVVGSSTTNGLEWRKVQLQLYEDELNGFPPPGSALVRVIHASPITPAVSVVVARRGQDAASEPIITDLTYPNEADYLAVEAGRVNFRMQDSASSQIITELENLELQAGTIYTFYIVATRSDNFVSIIPTIDAILAGQP